MPPLRIPDRYQPGLIAIIGLPRDAVDGMASVLARASEDLSSAQLGALVASDDPSVSSDTATSIVSTLASLYLLRAGLELPVPEVVEEISDAMVTNSSSDLKISDEDLPDFKNKLTALLDIDSLMRKWKSRDVLTEYERTFYGARILTDIRPIFDVDPEDAPIDFRISHTLKISCHEGPDHKDIYISLQDEDLDMLRSVLDRADAKADALRKIIKRVEPSRA